MHFYRIALFWLTLLSYANAHVIDFPSNLEQVPLEHQNPGIQAGTVAFALKNLGPIAGQGSKGTTYFVSKSIAEHVAVLKIVEGNVEYEKTQATQEARNLYTVGQLLGWGAEFKTDEDDDDRKWYFVMKSMGVNRDTAEKKAKMPADIAPQLMEDAKKRYKDQFQMKQKDPNAGNYVYHFRVARKWQAEIIDWHLGEWTSTKEKQPLNPLERESIKVQKPADEH